MSKFTSTNNRQKRPRKRVLKLDLEPGRRIHRHRWVEWATLFDYFWEDFLSYDRRKELEQKFVQKKFSKNDVEQDFEAMTRFREYLALFRNKPVTHIPNGVVDPNTHYKYRAEELAHDATVDSRRMIAAVIAPPFRGLKQHPELIPEDWFHSCEIGDLSSNQLIFFDHIKLTGMRVSPTQDFDMTQIIDSQDRKAMVDSRRTYRIIGTTPTRSAGRPSPKQQYLDTAEDLIAQGRKYPTRKQAIDAILANAKKRGIASVKRRTVRQYFANTNLVDELIP